MLVGEKVILEEIDPANIEQLRKWRNDPLIRKYFREYKDITVDEQVKWYHERGNNSDKSFVYFQITHTHKPLGGSVLLGCCGLTGIDFRLRKAELSIFLGSGRGEGNGMDALKLLFDYGFKELNLHKIFAEVYDNNEALRIYKKLGMAEDGILRDSYFHEGRYGNSIMLSMLEDEWRNKYGDKPLWK